MCVCKNQFTYRGEKITLRWLHDNWLLIHVNLGASYEFDESIHHASVVVKIDCRNGIAMDTDRRCVNINWCIVWIHSFRMTRSCCVLGAASTLCLGVGRVTG